MDDSVRRRLGMEPLALDDDDVARIDELGDEPALRALEALPTDQRTAVVGRVLDDEPPPFTARSRRPRWRAATLVIAPVAALLVIALVLGRGETGGRLWLAESLRGDDGRWHPALEAVDPHLHQRLQARHRPAPGRLGARQHAAHLLFDWAA